MYIPEFEKEIKDAWHFECIAEEIIDDLGYKLMEEGHSMPISEDGNKPEEDGLTFYWDDEAATLLTKKIDELSELGSKYFPNDNIQINPTMYKEV